MKYYCCLFILVTGLFVNCNCGYDEPVSEQPTPQKPVPQQPTPQKPVQQQPTQQKPKEDSGKLANILSENFQLEYLEEAIQRGSVFFPMKPPVFPTLQEKDSITEFVKELKNLFKNAKSTDKTVGKKATAELCKKYNEVTKACIVKNACRCRLHYNTTSIPKILLQEPISLEKLQLILIEKILNDLDKQQGFVFEKSTKTNLIISAKDDKKEVVFSLQKDVSNSALLTELDIVNVYKKTKENFVGNTPELRESNIDWQVCLLPKYKKPSHVYFKTICTQLSDFLDN